MASPEIAGAEEAAGARGIGPVPTNARPTESTTTHSAAETHASPLTEPVLPVARAAVAPVPSGSNSTALLSVLIARQKVAVGQESCEGWALSTAAVVTASGFAGSKVARLPSLPSATHRDIVGHETPIAGASRICVAWGCPEPGG